MRLDFGKNVSIISFSDEDLGDVGPVFSYDVLVLMIALVQPFPSEGFRRKYENSDIIQMPTMQLHARAFLSSCFLHRTTDIESNNDDPRLTSRRSKRRSNIQHRHSEVRQKFPVQC